MFKVLKSQPEHDSQPESARNTTKKRTLPGDFPAACLLRCVFLQTSALKTTRGGMEKLVKQWIVKNTANGIRNL